MSVLWKKIEFFKGESDYEAIIIAGGDLDGTVSHPVGNFSWLWGDRGLEDLPYQLKNKQYPLVLKVSPFQIRVLPTEFVLALHKSLSSHSSLHLLLLQLQ